MIRRDFLRRSAATVTGAGLAVLGARGTLAADALTRSSAVRKSFSLDVVTDRPTEVLNSIGSFLSEHRLSEGNVKVTMVQLVGEHVSDAVFVRNGRLVDFRTGDDSVAAFLQQLSRNFALRTTVSNPGLIRFSGGAQSGSGQAKAAQFFSGDFLIAQRPLRGDYFEEPLESGHGRVLVRYDQSGVRIVDATCKHKTCMKAGPVSSAGESLVCIPARLRVVMVGNEVRSDGVHVVTQ